MSIAVLLRQKQAPHVSPTDQGLPALRLVQRSQVARRLARALLVVFILAPFVLLLVPWQQSLSATGQVVALGASERLQIVDAPVDGRIKIWHVKEGSQVNGPRRDANGVLQPGDLLVTLEDPDPQLTAQLAREKEAYELRRKAAQERIDDLEAQIAALRRSQSEALVAAEKRLEMAKRRLDAADASLIASRKTLELTRFTYQMDKNLHSKGLVSGLEFQTSEQRKTLAEVELERATQAREGTDAEVKALSADLAKIRHDTESSIRSALASRRSAEADRAATEINLAQIEVRQARQAAQEVRSPCDGTILRILTNCANGGVLVKYGDPLLTLVPDIKNQEERMVELIVQGNDMPLITELWRDRRHRQGEEATVRVRLQFQGWPAIQFVGWPSVAYGTFGGIIHFVDAHADEKGNFRILVKPDPEEEKINPWPPDYSLRQGVRARGWVLLNQVTVGWEIWRKLNGFPPVVASTEPEDNLKKKKK